MQILWSYTYYIDTLIGLYVYRYLNRPQLSEKSANSLGKNWLCIIIRRDNAHVAVHGKVYDVSSYIGQHPEGADQIALGAGRDISQVFESYHSDKAFEMLERFYVGDLVSSEYPVYPPRGEFYRTLKQRVEKYFKENNIDPKYDP